MSKYLLAGKTAHQLTVRIKNLNMNRAPDNIVKVSAQPRSGGPWLLPPEWALSPSGFSRDIDPCSPLDYLPLLRVFLLKIKLLQLFFFLLRLFI